MFGNPQTDDKACNYTSVVEFGLNADVFAFFFVLCAEDLEFGRA